MMEHRLGRRVAITILVRMYCCNGMAGWGVARNISRDGMFIETAVAVEQGCCVDVRLTVPLPAGERTVPIPGLAVHRAGDGFGMLFRRLDRETRETVSWLLSANERPVERPDAGISLAGATRSASVGAAAHLAGNRTGNALGFR